MRLFIKSIDVLFLARPVILIPVWGFSIFGYWCSASVGKGHAMTLLWGKEAVFNFFYMVIFSLSVGAVYVLNQIADYAVDSRNEGFPLLVKSGISRRAAFIYAVLLGGFSILIPAALKNYSMVIFSIFAILLGTVYSFKPFYLSGRVIGDFLANATGYGIIAFGVGWSFFPDRNMMSVPFFRAALPYFFLMCGGSISSTLPDFSADKELGKRTTAVVLGIMRAHIVTIVFIIIGGIAALINKDLIAGTLALASFIIDILYSLIRSRKLMEATYKVGGSVAMLLAGILYPVFIPCALFVFLITWVYFRLRHGISYPSLIPVANVSNRS